MEKRRRKNSSDKKEDAMNLRIDPEARVCNEPLWSNRCVKCGHIWKTYRPAFSCPLCPLWRLENTILRITELQKRLGVPNNIEDAIKYLKGIIRRIKRIKKAIENNDVCLAAKEFSKLKDYMKKGMETER